MQPESVAPALMVVDAHLDFDDLIVDKDTEMTQGSKLLNLVAYLTHSGLALKLFSAVIQDVTTRWNPKLAMLDSVNKIFGD